MGTPVLRHRVKVEHLFAPQGYAPHRVSALPVVVAPVVAVSRTGPPFAPPCR